MHLTLTKTFYPCSKFLTLFFHGRFLARKLQYQNRCERFEHPDLEQYFEIPENENGVPNKYISPDKPLTAYISRIHEYGPVDPGSKILHGKIKFI